MNTPIAVYATDARLADELRFLEEVRFTTNAEEADVVIEDTTPEGLRPLWEALQPRKLARARIYADVQRKLLNTGRRA